MRKCFVYNNAECSCCKDEVCLDSTGDCRSFISSDHITDFRNKISILVNTYKISEEQAGCYLSNFDDEFICRKYNGGCKEYDSCKKISGETMK